MLVLTSSLLTDRMLAPTSILPHLGEVADVEVLAASLRPGDDPAATGAWPIALGGGEIRPFPPVSTVAFFPAGMLHRFTNAAWEHRHRPASRVDPERDGFPTPRRRWVVRVGTAMGALHLDGLVERAATVAAHRRTVPDDVTADLAGRPPALTVVTNPFHSFEPALAAAARRAGSTVIALIPSWDNLTTKGRLVFDYDGYLVWTDEQAATLRALYPRAARRPIHVVGTPQYDAFTDERFEEDRTTWAARHGLHADRPIVLYALGSPNLFDEVPAVAALVAATGNDGEDGGDGGPLAGVQLLVRCHPVHSTAELVARLEALGPDVHVQLGLTTPAGVVRERTQTASDLQDWVSTFRHADVVVNLSSTSAIDAAAFDRPVVNLDFDPGPGARRDALVREINRNWEHFAPVARSGGLDLVADEREMVAAVRRALDDPATGRDARARMATMVVGPIDGRSGDRFAAAVRSFLPESRIGGEGAGAAARGADQSLAARLRHAAGRVKQRSRKEWPLTWRWVHNLGPTVAHRRRPPSLTSNERALVDEVDRHGIAITDGRAVLGDDLVDGVIAAVAEREASQGEAIAAARAALDDDREKPYLHQPLGELPVLDLDSPYAAVADRLAPLADAYFGLRTQVRAYAVWHNLASPHPAVDSQLWHRDREDLLILKAFLYLDDVDEGAGPFWYAPGTHRKGGRLAAVGSSRQRGVARSTDDQLAAAVPRSAWRRAVGPAGTLVLADTRGFHKGGHATTQDRLVLMVLFTSRDSGVREWFDRSAHVPPTDPERRDRWSRGPGRGRG